MRDLSLKKENMTASDKLLAKKTLEGLYKYKEVNEEIVSRVEYELNTIMEMGFSDYFLIVQDFLDVGRRIGYMPKERIDYLRTAVFNMTIDEVNAYINEDQSYPGMTIGPGRGSAAGSIIAYLLGITSVEPISNGLIFERFLNPERVSMPDIDSDLSKSEFDYGVRDIVIEYVGKKYGHDGICGITTPSTLAARAAVKNVARVLGSKKAKDQNITDKDGLKSVAGQYLDLAEKINKLVPTDPKTYFDMKVNGDETLFETLKKHFANDKAALEVLNFAKELEGVNINFGKHACGVIIADNGDIGSYAPLMFDTKANGWKIQLNAEQAEASGLLKMDFLGLKNLNIITKTVRMVYENSNHNTFVDPLRIPQDPEVYKEVFSKGKTQAVFQFESGGMKKMLQRFKPENFSDIVLLVACYRPGPMQYLDGIIDRKHGKKTEKTAIDRIPQCADIVAPTYGAIVYQEQVQQIFRKLAGYSLGQADKVRRAMGHKKEDELIIEKQAFLHGDAERGIVGCEANGVNVADADELFENMLDFAKYAFNKSHAAAYAMTSYVTAYLKLHYPTEFYASVLSFSDLQDYPMLIQEAKSFGVHVAGPSIGESESDFTGADGKIFFGFNGIKGIGGDLTELSKDYKSFADFILNSTVGESVIESLINVGAFDRFCENRAALLNILPSYIKERKKIKESRMKICIAEEMLSDIENGIAIDREKYKIKTKSVPTKEKLEQKIETAKQAEEDAKKEIMSILIPVGQVKDNLLHNLHMEKELLGMYVSGNPFDAYGTPNKFNATYITDIDTETKCRISGIINNLRIVGRKSDGAKMAFFDLEDQSGSINVACFTSSFPAFEQEFSDTDLAEAEGKAVVLIGRKKQEDEEGEKATFIIDKNRDAIFKIEPGKPSITIIVEGVEEYAYVKGILDKHLLKNGYPVLLYNKTESRLLRTRYHVGNGIFAENLNISNMTESA